MRTMRIFGKKSQKIEMRNGSTSTQNWNIIFD
jgi:hypothetical protein